MIFQIGKDTLLQKYNFYYIYDIVYFRCLDLWFDGMNFFSFSLFPTEAIHNRIL